MNPFQLMQMLQNSANPQAMLMQMMGNNPMFQRAQQMLQGKTPQQAEQICRNLARQRGMNDAQFGQFLQQFGMKV